MDTLVVDGDYPGSTIAGMGSVKKFAKSCWESPIPCLSESVEETHYETENIKLEKVSKKRSQTPDYFVWKLQAF